MPCQSIVSCLVPMSCHGMPCQAHVVAFLVPVSWRGMPCLARCHALSCFQRLPGDKHKSCSDCTVTSTRRGIAKGAHVVACLVKASCRALCPCHVTTCLVKPMLWHFLCPCRGVACLA